MNETVMGEKIVALSCFDGISCARMAMLKAEKKIDSYFASEIDKEAIRITQHNFPDTKQIGDIAGIRTIDLPKINLLIGGSPCQGFSINGNRLNFEDERSKLLFEFIHLRDRLNPDEWLLENVATMDAGIKRAIDDLVGVTGIYINSNLYSAQNRKRVFWTNIKFDLPIFQSPARISDILEEVVSEKWLLSSSKISEQKFAPTTTDGVITLNPKRFNGKQTYQQDRIYDCRGKFPALTATLGNRFNILDNKGRYRKLTIREQARLQTIPDTYDFSIASDIAASKAIGNGWTVDVVANILNSI